MGDASVEKIGCNTYRTRHDMTQNGLTLTITEALVEVQEKSPVELVNGFTEHVDPDALDRLFRVPPSHNRRDESDRVRLRIHGTDVVVQAEGEIFIEP